jgi:phosphate transport system substrate-binding protein
MRAVAALLAVAAILTAAADARAAPTISMSGEQVTQALVADLAYFYRHRVRRPPRFSLTGGGTSAGIADTVRGITDAALVSRALTSDDPRGLKLTRLAVSGICLVTNKANPVPAITRAQLQDIVAGRVTRWSEIPGAARTDPIVPVDLGATSGAGRVFESVFIDGDTPITWRPVTLQTSAQARDYVEQDPAALAYVDLALVGPLHVLAYESVGCTRSTVRTGGYPARRPLGIVTRGRPRGALKRFLRWARTSRTARRVIATRYIPG